MLASTSSGAIATDWMYAVQPAVKPANPPNA